MCGGEVALALSRGLARRLEEGAPVAALRWHQSASSLVEVDDQATCTIVRGTPFQLLRIYSFDPFEARVPAISNGGRRLLCGCAQETLSGGSRHPVRARRGPATAQPRPQQVRSHAEG